MIEFLRFLNLPYNMIFSVVSSSLKFQVSKFPFDVFGIFCPLPIPIEISEPSFRTVEISSDTKVLFLLPSFRTLEISSETKVLFLLLSFRTVEISSETEEIIPFTVYIYNVRI